LQAGGDITVASGDELTDRRAARFVMDFLADRRVLHQPLDRECPQYCVDSAIKIREALTSVLGHLPARSAARVPVLQICQAERLLH